MSAFLEFPSMPFVKMDDAIAVLADLEKGR